MLWSSFEENFVLSFYAKESFAMALAIDASPFDMPSTEHPIFGVIYYRGSIHTGVS